MACVHSKIAPWFCQHSSFWGSWELKCHLAITVMLTVFFSQVLKCPCAISLALRASGATFGRPRGLWETDSSPYGCTQNLTHSAIQGRSSHLIEACVRPPADLVEPPGETGGTAGHPGDTDTGSSHLGEHLLLPGCCAGRSKFGILSCTCPCPPVFRK